MPSKLASLFVIFIFFVGTRSIYAENNVKNVSFGTGKIQVEIFTDFQCPACIRFHEVGMPVIENFLQQGKITIIHYQYPLTMIHKNAYQDSLAVLCAHDQGLFAQYSDGIFTLEDAINQPRLSLLDRVKLFQKIGGKNLASFRNCLITRKYKNKIKQDVAYGDSKNITGTPSVFIDGKRIENQLLFQEDSLRQLLLDHLK